MNSERMILATTIFASKKMQMHEKLNMLLPILRECSHGPEMDWVLMYVKFITKDLMSKIAKKKVAKKIAKKIAKKKGGTQVMTRLKSACSTARDLEEDKDTNSDDKDTNSDDKESSDDDSDSNEETEEEQILKENLKLTISFMDKVEAELDEAAE